MQFCNLPGVVLNYYYIIYARDDITVEDKNAQFGNILTHLC